MGQRKITHICDKAVTAYAKGDSEALSVVYDCMAKMIMATALAITDSREDAEDVLQDTIIGVARFAGSYKKGTNAKAWILAIARNKALDAVRKRNGNLPLEEAEKQSHEEKGSAGQKLGSGRTAPSEAAPQTAFYTGSGGRFCFAVRGGVLDFAYYRYAGKELP